MDTLSYVDLMFKEYLMWRGLPATFSTFSQEVAEISWMTLHPKQLVQLIFDSLIPSQKIDRLWEVLTYLSDHIYSRLSSEHEPAIRCVELAILQLYLVSASAAGRTAEMQSFFSKHGDTLLASPDSSSWLPWFSLPYVREPSKHALFKNFFKPEWRRMARLTCYNFFSEAFAAVPLPAIMQLESDRQRCAALTAQLHALEEENSQLRRRQQPQPASPPAGPAAPPPHNGPASPKNGGDSERRRTPAPTGQGPNGQHPSSPDGRQQAPPAPGAAPAASATRDASRDARSSAVAATDGATRGSPRLQERPTPGDDAPGAEAHSLADAAASSRPALLVLPSTLPGADAARYGTGESEDTDAAERWLDVSEIGEGGGASPGTAGCGEGGSETDVDWQRRADACQRDGPSVSSVRCQADASEQLSSAQTLRHASRDRPGCSWQLHTALSEAASGSAVVGVQAQVFEGHSAPVSAACFAPDGRNVASGDHNGDVHIWCTEDGGDSARRCGSFNAGGAVTCIEWDRRAGKILLVGTQGAGMKAWHADTGRCVLAIPADGCVRALACSPREPLFAAACEAGAGDRSSEPGLRGPLSIWNLRSFKPVHAFQPAELRLSGLEHVSGAAFTSDGSIIAAASTAGDVVLLSASTWQLLSQFQVGRTAAAFALLPANGARDLLVAAAGDAVQAFRIAGASPLTAVQLVDQYAIQPASRAAARAAGGPGDAAASAAVFSAAAGRDRHAVAVVAAGNVVLLQCDLMGRVQPVGALVAVDRERHVPSLVVWHPCGRSLLVAASDGCLQLLDCETTYSAS